MQSGPVNCPLPSPLVVGTYNQFGDPLSGVRIQFSAETGTLTPSVAQSQPNGLAQAVYTPTGTPGSVTVVARSDWLDLSLEFEVTSLPNAPTTFLPFSGNNQSAVAGAAPTSPLVVRVAGACNNSMSDLTVTWTASGGVVLSTPTSLTATNGRAQVTVTLPPQPGTYSVTASFVGFDPVVFTVVATAPPVVPTPS
jgi:hypothetical protein